MSFLLRDIPELRRRFGEIDPRPSPGHAVEHRRAATAVIVAPDPNSGDELSLLLIERTRRAEDPWSGHISFPGGHLEEEDPGLDHTARREAREEVGVSLPSTPSGRLEDVVTRSGAGTLVRPFVYFLEETPDVRADPVEVESILWVSCCTLLDPRAAVSYRPPELGGDLVFPGIQVDLHTIWGVTYRTLEAFFSVAGRSLPRR